MAQSWTTLLGSMDLDQSRIPINENFESLRSAFSGTTEPSGAVAGQFWIHPTTKIVRQHNGTGWVELFDLNAGFGDLVSRSHTNDCPMRSALHMAGYQIRNLGNPSANTDAVTLGYAKDELIDKHYHSGAGDDGPKVSYGNLSGVTTTPFARVGIGSTATLVDKAWGSNFNDTQTDSGDDAFTDQISVTVSTYANEPKLVVAGCQYQRPSGGTQFWLRLVYDQGAGDVEILQVTPQIVANATPHSIVIPTTATPTAEASVTYTLQAKDQAGGSEVYLRAKWIVVL